jgi:hypothetical protein
LQAQIPSIPDTGRVIILSARVGPNINPVERQKFDLFESILVRHFGSTLSFRSAVVLQFPDSTFCVRFTVGRENEKPRDTLIVYSYGILCRIAEKIEHFEEIQSGKYQPVDNPPPLLSSTGEPVMVKARSVPLDSKASRADSRAPMRLPLASTEGYVYPRYFPALNFGIGFRTYDPDLSGLSRVFGTTPSFGLSPLITGFAEIAIAEAFAIQIEGALSAGGEKANQGAVGGTYYVPLVSSRTVHAFASAAILWCSITAEKSGIVVQGGGVGFSGTTGVQLQLGKKAAVEVCGGLCSLPDVATTFTELKPSTQNSPAQTVTVPASIKLSSLTFGLRLKFFE